MWNNNGMKILSILKKVMPVPFILLHLIRKFVGCFIREDIINSWENESKGKKILHLINKGTGPCVGEPWEALLITILINDNVLGITYTAWQRLQRLKSTVDCSLKNPSFLGKYVSSADRSCYSCWCAKDACNCVTTWNRLLTEKSHGLPFSASPARYFPPSLQLMDSCPIDLFSLPPFLTQI